MSYTIAVPLNTIKNKQLIQVAEGVQKALKDYNKRSFQAFLPHNPHVRPQELRVALVGQDTRTGYVLKGIHPKFRDSIDIFKAENSGEYKANPREVMRGVEEVIGGRRAEGITGLSEAEQIAALSTHDAPLVAEYLATRDHPIKGHQYRGVVHCYDTATPGIVLKKLGQLPYDEVGLSGCIPSPRQESPFTLLGDAGFKDNPTADDLTSQALYCAALAPYLNLPARIIFEALSDTSKKATPQMREAHDNLSTFTRSDYFKSLSDTTLSDRLPLDMETLHFGKARWALRADRGVRVKMQRHGLTHKAGEAWGKLRKKRHAQNLHSKDASILCSDGHIGNVVATIVGETYKDGWELYKDHMDLAFPRSLRDLAMLPVTALGAVVAKLHYARVQAIENKCKRATGMILPRLTRIKINSTFTDKDIGAAIAGAWEAAHIEDQYLRSLEELVGAYEDHNLERSSTL